MVWLYRPAQDISWFEKKNYTITLWLHGHDFISSGTYAQAITITSYVHSRESIGISATLVAAVTSRSLLKSKKIRISQALFVLVPFSFFPSSKKMIQWYCKMGKNHVQLERYLLFSTNCIQQFMHWYGCFAFPARDIRSNSVFCFPIQAEGSPCENYHRLPNRNFS